MRSIQSALSAAISGLYANKKSLDTTAHNIANVDNPNYVRQQVIQTSSRYSPSANGQFKFGNGVDIEEIRQIRDEFLDIRFRTQSQELGYWSAKNSVFEQVQDIVNEMSDSGLQKVMDQFWNSWNELAKNPDNLTIRGLVKERAIAFTETVNHIHHQLDSLQINLNKDIKNSVSEINTIAREISNLNRSIIEYEGQGLRANDYRDARNGLLDKLSQMVNIQCYEEATGAMNVSVGGKSLVNGLRYNEMSAENNASSYVDVYWKETVGTSDPTKVSVKGGELLGLIESRGDVESTILPSGNGNATWIGDIDKKEIIPSIKHQLNKFVNTLVTEINTVHQNGYTLTGTNGGNLFTAINSTLPIQTGNIQFNPAYGLNDIAASLSGAKGDGKNAEKIAEIRETYIFGDVNCDDYYRDVISDLGVSANEAVVMNDSLNIVTSEIDNKRRSMSGVSLDEEMTDMLKYQHSYVANSRVVNAVDEMLDRIINRMGRAGL